jgi:hypothetical protein
MNDGHPAKPPGEAAHDVGANAAVKMQKVGLGGADQSVQPWDEQCIHVATHGQAMDLGEWPGRPGDIAALATSQEILDAPAVQPFHQVKDLQGAAVEIAAAFDVEDFH